MSKLGQKVHDKKVFRPYNQEQLMLPMSIDSLIPANHVVRVVNGAIDKMNLDPLLAKYPGGGRSSFNPVMMAKLISNTQPVGEISLESTHHTVHRTREVPVRFGWGEKAEMISKPYLSTSL